MTAQPQQHPQPHQPQLRARGDDDIMAVDLIRHRAGLVNQAPRPHPTRPHPPQRARVPAPQRPGPIAQPIERRMGSPRNQPHRRPQRRRRQSPVKPPASHNQQPHRRPDDSAPTPQPQQRRPIQPFLSG